MKSITTCIQPVWKFLNSNLPLFIWNVVFGVPLEQLDDSLNLIKGAKPAATNLQNVDQKLRSHEFELDEDLDVFNNIESLAVQLVELMATLIQKPTLHVLIRFGLFPLINCLSQYMFLSKEQVYLRITSLYHNNNDNRKNYGSKILTNLLLMTMMRSTCKA